MVYSIMHGKQLKRVSSSQIITLTIVSNDSDNNCEDKNKITCYKRFKNISTAYTECTSNAFFTKEWSKYTTMYKEAHYWR